MTTVLPIKRESRKDFELSLDEIAREGARRLLVQALNLEVEDYIQQCTGEVDESGKRLVVRNGAARRCHMTIGSGAVAFPALRLSARRIG